MEGEFIAKCPSCGRHSLFVIVDIRNAILQEKMTGQASCKTCEYMIPIELTRCPNCQLGWENKDIVPTVTELNEIRQPLATRMGTPCLLCNPQLRENMLIHGHPYLQRAT